MPPDAAFLLSDNAPQRTSNRPTQQHGFPHFSSQGNADALDGGHAYAQDMSASPTFPYTVDPTVLLPMQIPMFEIRAESVSESEAELEIGGESDSDKDDQFEGDDAAGWALHPDTIRVGIPDFYNTKTRADMRDAAGVQVPVVIHARFVLKKRAARQRACWILYRRNYFGIQGSYNLKPLANSCANETLYLYRDNYRPEPIRALFMCMRGVVEKEEGPEIKIVVFNAKRKPLHEGKGTPPIQPQRMKPLTEGSIKYYVESTGDRQDHMNVPMNHTFHRNQFRAATQNNGARRTEQQYYHILLELKAEVIVDGVAELFTVASTLSDPLVVRGRCPLSFKKNKGHTRSRDRKGRRPYRDGGGHGNKGVSTRQSQKGGRTKGVSRGFVNQTNGSSIRSTRGSSHLPGLTHGTRSRNTDTTPVSPLPATGAHGTVNGETIPRLDRKLLSLARDTWEGDRGWESAGPFLE